MADAPTPITWTIHLAARKPARAVLAILVIIFALFAIAALKAPTLVVVLAAVLLLGSIAEFLFPVTYTLDANGAHARYLGSHRIIPWARVRRVYLRRNGIKLSPLVSGGWVESYRGVVLRSADRDATLKSVLAWTEASGATPEIIEET